MDTATQSHLTSLREALELRLRELHTEIAAAALERRDEPDVLLQEVSDRKDQAEQRQLAEVRDEESRRDLEDARQVEAALQRLLEGRYGDCLDCGESIGLQRLQVQPAALRCIRCQSMLEQHQGPSHSGAR
jgi:RNA polymerase-binding transcription factor DksA